MCNKTQYLIKMLLCAQQMGVTPAMLIIIHHYKITSHKCFKSMWSAVQYKSGESRIFHLLEMSCFLLLDLIRSCGHICALGDSCGQSTAQAFIDLFTSIFLALLKLFTSDTWLYSSNIPESFGWRRPLWVCVCVSTTLHNSYCTLCIEVRDCYRRFCSSFSWL